MAEIIINDVKYTNVPNKKAGTKFASALTQSNIGMSQAVQDYVNSSYFYALINAIDINWDGIDIGENTYINTTSDLIKWIESKAGDIDLSSYATVAYVNQKFEDLIGGAPETLDTLKELADALQEDASLAYVTQALEGKANANDVYTKTEVDNMIPEPVDLSNYVSYTQANSYYVAKEDMPDLNDYATTSYVTTELDKKANADYHVEMIIGGPINSPYGNWYTFNRTFKGYNKCYLFDTFYFIIYDNKHNVLFDSREWTGTKSQLVTHLQNNYNLQFFTNEEKVSDYYLEIVTKSGIKYLRMNFNEALNYSDIISEGKLKFGISRYSNYVNYVYATLTYDDFGFRRFVDSIIVSNQSTNLAYYYTKTQSESNFTSYSYINEKIDEITGMIPAPVDLSNYVSYTDANSYYMTVEGPKQIINSVKTFVGNKLINFRQGQLSDKIGFTLYNIDEKEVGGLEWRPNTIGTRGLLSLQQYLGTGSKYTGVDMGYLGFRLTEVSSKYHLITPLPSYVNTIEPINVGSDYRNFFFPLVFKNGSNKVYADCTGLVDMTSLMPDLNDYATTSYVTTELNKKANTNDVYTKTEVDNLIPAPVDLSGYATTSYVTTELDKKADKTQLPDMTQYVTMSSYNALAARVEELASWIVSYHTPTPTPTPTFEFTYGGGTWTVYNSGTDSVAQWLNNTTGYTANYSSNNANVTVDQSTGVLSWIVGGETATITATATAGTYTTSMNVYTDNGGSSTKKTLQVQTQSQSISAASTNKTINILKIANVSTQGFVYNAAEWSYTCDTGITVDGNITTSGSSTLSIKGTITGTAGINGTYNIYVNFTGNNDFEPGQWLCPVTLYGGSEPLYFSSNNINIQSGSNISGYLVNNTAIDTTLHPITWSSDNAGVTVDSTGTVNFVSAQSANITATLSDGTTSYTATCYVSYQKATATASWSNTSGGTEVTVVAGDTNTVTCTFNGTPASGWAINDPIITGITVNTTTGDVSIDPTNMMSGDYYVYATYPEDSSYNYGTGQLSIRVLPSGTNPNFYYSPNSITIYNDGMSSSGTLVNNYNLTQVNLITYESSAPSIATVDSSGMVSFVSSGNATITAEAKYDDGQGGQPTVVATATLSVYCEVQKSYPYGSWTNAETGTQVTVVAGDTNTVTCTFNGTPASGWFFSESTIPGITVNTTTGDVNIDPTNMMSGNYNVDATYNEDSSYYYGSNSLQIKVLPSGTNPNFYFRGDVYVSDGMPGTVDLYNNLTYDHIDYSSNDTSIATVDSNGFVTWVSGGNTTITATAYDSNNTVLATATCNVFCNKPSSSGVWSNISALGKCIVVAGDTNTVTCTFSGTPASGWTISDPMITGITVDAANYTVTIDPTNMMSGDYYVTATYLEDSYYYGSGVSLNIKVLPSGSDVNFFFENNSYSLDDTMSQSMNIYVETTISNPISWSSSDTGVCSITQSQMNWNGAIITYVSAGSATLTATVDDNGTTRTATCTVTCSSMTP